MWEKLVDSLVSLMAQAEEYLKISTAIKQRELDKLETAPTPAAKVRLIVENTPEEVAKQPEEVEDVEEVEEPEKVDETAVEDTFTEEATEQPEKTEETAEIDGEVWWGARETAKFLGISMSYLSHIAKMGWIPSRVKAGGKRNEYPGHVLREFGSLDDLRWRAAVDRGNTDKERRWRVTDMLTAPNCYKAYAQGTTRGAHFSRIWGAKNAGILNTYTLMEIEYINLDELGRFTDWWDRDKHLAEKNAGADFHFSNDPYCVHENDLIWVLTRDYNAQTHPTEEQVRLFNRLAGDIPSVRVKGVRFYRPEAIKKMEDLRKTISPDDFVD